MKLIKLFFNGISWGCTISTFILIIGAAAVGDSFLTMDADYFIKQAVGAMIVGIGFSVPSLIYDKTSLNRKLQTLLHMGTGFLIYFPIAYCLDWIPTAFGWKPILISIIVALITSFIIWYGYYLYYRKEAQKINQKLQELQ